MAKSDVWPGTLVADDSQDARNDQSTSILARFLTPEEEHS